MRDFTAHIYYVKLLYFSIGTHFTGTVCFFGFTGNSGELQIELSTDASWLIHIVGT